MRLAFRLCRLTRTPTYSLTGALRAEAFPIKVATRCRYSLTQRRSLDGIGTTGRASLGWIGPTSPWSLSAEDGSYFLDLTDYIAFGPYGGVSQTFATTAGHKYEVTFWLGSSPEWGIQDSLTASAAGASETFTSTNSGSQINLWQPETFDFTANSSITTLSLLGANADNDIGLDNVVATDLAGVVVVTGGTVPEPATWAMMVLGFAGLGWLARPRRRKVAPGL